MQNKEQALKEIDAAIAEYKGLPDGHHWMRANAAGLIIRFRSVIERWCPSHLVYAREAGQYADQVLKKDSTQERGHTEFVHYYAKLVQRLRESIAEETLGNIYDMAKLETCGDIIDQADSLLQDRHEIAAAVLCGGALETHLRMLCDRMNLAVEGDGSIAKYDGAIARFRKEHGNAPYDGTTSKLVLAWGGMRNDAAHEPTSFSNKHDKPTVSAMLIGVRAFLDRVR